MKIGDIIKILDEEGIGIIKQISGNIIWIENEYGFEVSYQAKELLPISPSDTSPKIEVTKKEIQNKIKNIPPVKIKKHKETEEIREIDLHIGNLVDSLKNISPYQMLQKQLSTAKIEIERARKDRVKKLILIHGKGKGVLKQEIYNLLNSIERIEFFEADIMKYRFGAVEIRFLNNK